MVDEAVATGPVVQQRRSGKSLAWAADRLRDLGRAVSDVPAVHALARRVYPGAGGDDRRRRLTFHASAFAHPREHGALVDFFARDPWRAVGLAHPQLFQKIHKPFPYRGPEVAERVRLVRRHYELALERFGPALLVAVGESRELALCDIALPNGNGALPVRLGKHQRFEREGELTLSLIDPFGSLLYSICFTLRERDGEVGLLVGSLNGTAPRAVLRHLTKLGWGLRPQSLLVFLVQQVAQLAGARHIDAVGRATHAYWGNPRHDQIRFDYDAFWLEEGGVPLPDGLFRLPLQPRRRAATDIPSQKRSLYQHRYEWLADVAASVQGDGRRALAGEGDATA